MKVRNLESSAPLSVRQNLPKFIRNTVASSSRNGKACMRGDVGFVAGAKDPHYVTTIRILVTEAEDGEVRVAACMMRSFGEIL
eukprot:scaffold7328_cov314-Pinguiococcus_pyrenoidosus.AAC.63